MKPRDFRRPRARSNWEEKDVSSSPTENQETYFAALGGGVGLLVLVRTHTEVLDGFTGVPLAAEKDSVRAGRRTERKLVEGEDLTTSLEDALLGGGGDTEGGDRQLGDLKQTDVVGDGANGDNDLGVTVGRIRSLLDNAGKGNGGAVGLGEEETVEDGLRPNGDKFVLFSH